MTSEINISEDLDLFVRQHATDYCAMQLILFFAYHPFTRFSWLAISQYLKQVGKKHPVRKVLADFAEKGIIQMDTRNNVPVYSLSEEIQNTVSELMRLDVRQQQKLLRQAFQTHNSIPVVEIPAMEVPVMEDNPTVALV